MQAHILSLYTSLTPCVKTFLSSHEMGGVIMIMEPRAPCKHILSPYTSSIQGGVKRSNILFESSRVKYQINGNIEHHASTYSVLTHTHTHTSDPWGGVKLSKHFVLKVFMLHIKLKRIEYRAPGNHIFCPYAHTLSPWRGVKRSKHFFS